MEYLGGLPIIYGVTASPFDHKVWDSSFIFARTVFFVEIALIRSFSEL